MKEYISKELMIGNLVVFNNEIVEFDSHKAWHINDLEPIPLTKEWLVKLGFDANIIIYSHPKNRRLAVKLWDDPKIKFILFWKNLVIRELDVFYVHQLQNLFYSLTGEELKIS